LRPPLKCCSLAGPPHILWLGSSLVKQVPAVGLLKTTVSKYRKYLEFTALFLLAGLIIWWFGRRLDWDQVKLAIRKSDWRLILLASVIILIAYFWRAIRWQALLKPLTEASLREVWVATTVGFAAILLIGRAGEVVRPVVLPMRDHRVRPAASFVTIMIERLYDSVTVVFLFAFPGCEN
jgi:uncharacterized membrane protein YbhN (UPF0104 family)